MQGLGAAAKSERVKNVGGEKASDSGKGLRRGGWVEFGGWVLVGGFAVMVGWSLSCLCAKADKSSLK